MIIKGQISIFDLLDEYKTPTIPAEEQKKGVKGWIMEISAICLRENGFKEDYVTVCTRPVVFKEDTRESRDGWWQAAETTYGPSTGWYGSLREVYRKRPTWQECAEYAQRKHPEISDIRYSERNGNWDWINGYENGYQKGA